MKTKLFLVRGILVALAPAVSPNAQEIPTSINTEDLVRDVKLFLTVASKALKWEEPADPLKNAGPLYFVGTTGLSSFLFVTSAGNNLSTRHAVVGADD